MEAKCFPVAPPFPVTPILPLDHFSRYEGDISFEIGRRRYFPDRYAWIARAACLPAPMARMTVAAPVTMSPPA